MDVLDLFILIFKGKLGRIKLTISFPISEIMDFLNQEI